MRPLVQELANAMRGEHHGPFAFYGHSMGALIGFELARELRRRNCDMPAHLFLSACHAPNVVTDAPSTFNLPVLEFIAAIQKLKGTPKEFFEHIEIQNAFLPLLRADFELTDTYEYLAEPPLACPITVYGGEQDELTTETSLFSWDVQTSAEYTLRLFPGDHFFIRCPKTEFVTILRQDVLRALSLA
jgi:medium-chain acyl-[acyl-carrier-protein] hydrolase